MKKEEVINRIREVQSKITEAQQRFNPTKAWDCIDYASGLLLALKLALQSDRCPDVISSDDIELQGELLTDIISEFMQWRLGIEDKILNISKTISLLQVRPDHFIRQG